MSARLCGGNDPGGDAAAQHSASLVSASDHQEGAQALGRERERAGTAVGLVELKHITVKIKLKPHSLPQRILLRGADC